MANYFKPTLVAAVSGDWVIEIITKTVELNGRLHGDLFFSKSYVL
jgi:hypothetical protein